MKDSLHFVKDIRAWVEQVFPFFTDPLALQRWQVPANMSAKLHHFDGRVGGGYRLSLFYKADAKLASGKTAALEDRYTASFLEIVPGKKIVQSVQFENPDPACRLPMAVEAQFREIRQGTRLTLIFSQVPVIIDPVVHALGIRSALEKLAQLAERKGAKDVRAG